MTPVDQSRSAVLFWYAHIQPFYGHFPSTLG